MFWIHASNVGRFEQSIRDIANQAKIPGREDEKADMFQLLRSWLRNEKHGRWVAILDNADDIGFLVNAVTVRGRSTAYSTLFECLPACDHGSILITSRSSNAARRLVGDANIIALSPMQEEEAIGLLRKKLGKNVTQTALIQLAIALECLPLAIAQATAYIKRRTPRCSVEQYLYKYARCKKSRINLLSANAEDLRRDREATNSIILTWQISFEHIYQSRRSAADLLSLMSFFDCQGIPETVLRAEDVAISVHSRKTTYTLSDEDDKDDNPDDSFGASGDETFEEDVATLYDYSFISVVPKNSTFGMHRLVQLAVQKWLQSRGRYQQWAERSIRNLDKVLPNGNDENWADCRILYPHVMSALHVGGGYASISWPSVLYKAAWFTWQQGFAAEAEVMAASCLRTRRRMLGNDHPDTLTSVSNLASMLQDQGKYEAAEEMNRQALEGYEKVLGKEHPDTLTSVSNLASVLRDQGKYEAAEEMNRQALEGYKKVVGKEHSDTLTSVSNLASVLRDQGKYEAAEEMNRQALEGYEKVLGKEHPDTLTSVSNLASVLRDQGKYEVAEEMNRRALEEYERVLGKEHPYTLTSVSNLASVLRDQGKYEAAEEMNRRTLEGYEKVLGKEHPDTLTSVSNLASVLRDQGKYEAAEEMNRQALEGYEKVLGKEHPYTLTSVSNLVLVLQDQGKYEAAEEMNRQALDS